MMFTLLITMIIAFVASVTLTPVVRVLARRVDLIDRPDRQRKLHRRPIPLGGGLAVFAATLIGVTAVLLIPGEVREGVRHSATDLAALLIAAAIILAIGLADDRHALRGRQKLAGQMLAVGVLIYSGLISRHLHILEWDFDLGLLAVPFTMCWLLGAINSLNLLDGADGFATTIGIIISGAIAVMAVLTGHVAEAAVAMALTGAQLGFLIFNYPPASIFLGDAGSMLIGLTVGALAIRSSLKGPATIALAAPLAMLAIPFFDTAITILRRWLTGRSLYVGDRGHLHHNLLRRGLGPQGLLLCVATLCGLTAAGALVGVYLQNEWCAVVSMTAVLSILVVSRVFGFNELVMLSSRALNFGNSLVSPNRNDGIIRQERLRLQGSRNWDELWLALTDFAEQHELSSVRLDLNAAWLHEGFHANWYCNQRSEDRDDWLTRFPIRTNGRTLGWLEFGGPADHAFAYQLLGSIADLMHSLEPTIFRLATELPKDTSVDETCEPMLSVAATESQEVPSPD